MERVVDDLIAVLSTATLDEIDDVAESLGWTWIPEISSYTKVIVSSTPNDAHHTGLVC
jgi:hypothetical protein